VVSTSAPAGCRSLRLQISRETSGTAGDSPGGPRACAPTTSPIDNGGKEIASSCSNDSRSCWMRLSSVISWKMSEESRSGVMFASILIRVRSERSSTSSRLMIGTPVESTSSQPRVVVSEKSAIHAVDPARIQRCPRRVVQVWRSAPDLDGLSSLIGNGHCIEVLRAVASAFARSRTKCF
jgi:hypothetical protein